MLERGRRGVELFVKGIRWIAPTIKEIVASIVSGVCTAVLLLWIEPQLNSPPPTPSPTPTPTPNAGPTPIPNATLTPTMEPPMSAPITGPFSFVLSIGLTVFFLVLIVTVNRVRYVSQ